MTKFKRGLRFIVRLQCTGKPFSEALILASTNPQYDKELFIELPVGVHENSSSEHVVYKNCVFV